MEAVTQARSVPSASQGDDPLMGELMACVPPGKRRLHWEYVPDELKERLRERYGSLPEAARLADQLLRLKRYRERWPAGWWDRVDPAPLFATMERAVPPLNAIDRLWLERLCAAARRHRRPPLLTPEDSRRLAVYGPPGRLLERMGVPYIKRPDDLNAMTAFWESEGPEGRSL